MLYALWLPGLNFWRKFQPRQLSPIQEQGYYTLRSFTPIDGGEKQAILIFTYQLLLLLPCKTATATGARGQSWCGSKSSPCNHTASVAWLFPGPCWEVPWLFHDTGRSDFILSKFFSSCWDLQVVLLCGMSAAHQGGHRPLHPLRMYSALIGSNRDLDAGPRWGSGTNWLTKLGMGWERSDMHRMIIKMKLGLQSKGYYCWTTAKCIA